MPRRVSKSAKYSADKKAALKNLNKVELKEKLETKKSELHEVQDNMRIESNNLKENNPRELQRKSQRYTEMKQVRDTTINDITSINNELKINSQPDKITRKDVNIGMGV